MSVATIKRHKYRFPSRIDAEQAYERVEKERTELARAVNAITRDEVYYLPRVGPYLVGIFWLDRANGHSIIRQPASNGASPMVHDIDDLLEWIDRDNGAGSFDADLRRVAYYVRQIRARYWREVDQRHDGKGNEQLRQIIRETCQHDA